MIKKKHHEVAAKLKNLGSEFLFSAEADAIFCSVNSYNSWRTILTPF